MRASLVTPPVAEWKAFELFLQLQRRKTAKIFFLVFESAANENWWKIYKTFLINMQMFKSMYDRTVDIAYTKAQAANLKV